MLFKKPNLTIPKHVAIIMDGNGRWAKKRGLPRSAGHKEGSKNLRKIVENASDIGIEVITVYAFSTENWKRPKEEVSFLMKLIKKYFNDWMPDLIKERVKVTFIGEMETLPKDVLEVVNETERKTASHDRITLNIALNYGSHNEMLKAVKNIINDNIKSDDINEDLFEQYLMTKDLPKIDLLIRTSGEYRLSNFLLWQLAYCEFYFTDVLWPDFNKKELEKAIAEYSKRNRRYGGI